MKFVFFLLVILLNSCSTVEKYTYFSPTSDVGERIKPSRQYCGMAQFGKEPDAIKYDGVVFQSNSSWEPYLFGPWLITVVPVFPLTWAVDAFIDSNLEVTINNHFDRGKLPEQSMYEIEATLEDGTITKVLAEATKVNLGLLKIEFPIKANKVKAFKLFVDTGEASPVKFEFIKTNRWAWTQHCIN